MTRDLGQGSEGSTSKRQLFLYGLAALSLVVGLLGSGVVWLVLTDAERELAELRFHAGARERSLVFEDLLDRVAFETTGLATYLRLDPDLDREAFARIAQRPLDRRTIVHAMGWNPRVRAEDRAEYEARARALGLLDGGITERAPSGGLVPAGARDDYVVVRHIHPRAGNEAAIGYDVASEPRRLEALSRARDTAELAITAPIHLVQDEAKSYSVLAFAPMYEGAHAPQDVAARRDALLGFAVGVLRVPGLVEDALKHFEAIEAHAYLLDETVEGRSKLIYADSLSAGSDGAAASIDGALPELKGKLHHVQRVEWGGRSWRLVLVATDTYGTASASLAPIIALLAGLAFTLLLGAYLVLSVRHGARVEALVDDLTAANVRLEDEVEHRQRAEVALRSSEERLLLTVEAVTDGGWDWNITTGEVAFSDNWRDAMGYDRDTQPTQIDDVRDLVHPDERAAVEAGMQRHLDGGTPIYEAEMRLRLGDGGYRWSRTRGRVVSRDEAGRPLRMVGADNDITARKVAEESQHRLERRVQQTQKLHSLGLLAGGIAHDFNNLLVGILSSAEYALDELSPSAEVRTELEGVRLSASRVAELTRQMLDYAGHSQRVVKPIDVNALISKMLRLLRASTSKTVTLHADLLSSGSTVEGDPAQLQQVVMNLITNASEAIDGDDGTIRVRTGLGRPRVEPGTLTIGELESEDEHIFLEVSDDGPGMEPDTVSQMFDPFFTTKFQGRGLGLAAVVGIVGQHNGCVTVDSTLGQGTVVRIYLPASDAQAELPDAETSEDDRWRGKGRVLVADDEENVRALMVRILERLGFEVVAARDGQEAVEAFSRAPGDFALVVLDVTMPRVSGSEACRQILAQRPDVPVILVSGYTEEVGLRGTGDIGYTQYLQKPFSMSVLRDAVKSALGTKA